MAVNSLHPEYEVNQDQWRTLRDVIAGEREVKRAGVSEIQIDQGAVAAASKRGLRAAAVGDVTARARGVFRLVNGVPRAFEGDGQTVRYGKDGVTPMGFEEWAEGLLAEVPHWFEQSAGGGAAGSGASGVGNVRNPWRKGQWNVTEQMKLIRTDPKLAEQLRNAAAGAV